jgi:hypothetical protein
VAGERSGLHTGEPLGWQIACGGSSAFAGPYTHNALGPMRDKRAVLVTALSAIIAVVSALQMRDHVRLVEIIGLFASGAGTGAGIAVIIVGRKRRIEGAAA